MRKGQFGKLLAGTALAFVIASPTAGVASPDRVQSVLPPPPMLNGQRAIRRNTAPAPLPPSIQQRTTINRDAVPTPPVAPARANAGAPRPSDTGSVPDKAPPNTAMAAVETQAGEKLRDIIAAKDFDKRVTRAPERKGIETFYAARNYAPLWVQNGQPTERAKAVIARLENAGDDGFDPADYPVPAFSAGSDAAAELTLTNSVLDYARHLAVGRIAAARVTAEVDYGNRAPNPGDILKKIAETRDIDAVFNDLDPTEPGFHTLKAKLAGLRAQASEGNTDRIPGGPLIKPGAKDPRIPLVRERLRVSGKPDDITYDRALYDAVRRAQHNAGIKPSGIIGANTLAMFNGPDRGQMVDRVLANMERLRWLPRDLGRNYVMVNVPDYTLKVIGNGRKVWDTKIIVGKPQTPTPLLSAPMDQVIVNPSWYVPQSIIQNELLPAYETDRNIFTRMGLEVKRGPDGHINVVQPPGAANALGRIKFTFPNRYQVYLHDTPDKRLFSRSQRAFSHGCVRVEDPTKFGEVVLSLAASTPALNARQINAMFGQEERPFKMAQGPRIHLTYQTAFVDDAGKLQFRDDIYGFDARMHAIMSTDERRIADVAPPPDPKRDLATLQSNQEILRRVERREALNPFAFFEKLFR